MQACPRKVPVSGRLTKSPSELGSTKLVLGRTCVARLFRFVVTHKSSAAMRVGKDRSPRDPSQQIVWWDGTHIPDGGRSRVC